MNAHAGMWLDGCLDEMMQYSCEGSDKDCKLAAEAVKENVQVTAQWEFKWATLPNAC